MELQGIHFLLTYTCNFACDHCFLYCGPEARGTFTISQIRRILDDAQSTGTVNTIYFEGGEPTLYYPVMIEGIRLAREKGFEVGVVTNAYWATCIEDAEIWLKPIAELNISNLSVSNDLFHYDNPDDSPALRAYEAAEKLGIPVGLFCTEKPIVESQCADGKGEPVVGGSTLLKGRAVDKLAEELPTRPMDEFNECDVEKLESPSRLHVDPFGNLHICQGIVVGNAWQEPLTKITAEYNALDHPICGPLVKGGPAQLAKEYGVCKGQEFVSACHLCYKARLKLIDRFPNHLAPRQVYGL